MQRSEAKYWLSYVGRALKDIEDGQTYQAQRVVKIRRDKKKPPIAYYELVRVNEHANSKRMTEWDYEYQK